MRYDAKAGLWLPNQNRRVWKPESPYFFLGAAKAAFRQAAGGGGGGGISFDAFTNAYTYANATTPPSNPFTFNLTVGTGSNRILTLPIQQRGGTLGTVTGITFNGDTLTEVTAHPVSGAMRSYLYYLVAPDEGTHSVSVSHNMTGGTFVKAQGVSFFGVDQASPIDASNTAAANDAGPMTTTVTTTVPNTVIVDSCAMRVDTAQTAAMTAMTNRVERLNELGGTGVRGLVSTVIPAASATGYAMEWTKTYSRDWALIVAALKAA